MTDLSLLALTLGPVLAALCMALATIIAFIGGAKK